MSTFVLVEREQVQIPDSVRNLQSFRAWAHSDAFPEAGRIDWLAGNIWVDMTVEQVFSHNQVKQEFNVVLGMLARQERLGRFFPDGVLVTNADADLSVQPDGTFVRNDSFVNGRVRLIEGKTEGYLELEGAPDIVLEVVSGSSVTKDYTELRALYRSANVAEYWIADARGDTPQLLILQRGDDDFEAVTDGEWANSAVLKRAFRLVRESDALGNPDFRLLVRAS